MSLLLFPYGPHGFRRVQFKAAEVGGAAAWLSGVGQGLCTLLIGARCT